jgi:hypothetical protein
MERSPVAEQRVSVRKPELAKRTHLSQLLSAVVLPHEACLCDLLRSELFGVGELLVALAHDLRQLRLERRDQRVAVSEAATGR